MGFKSVMKKIGKVALKAAPFALDFIPGGLVVHLALAAGLGAAGAASDHKGLKGILGGAALGAGSFEGSHLLGKLGKVGGASKNPTNLGESTPGFSGGIDGYSDIIPKLGGSAADGIMSGVSLGEKGLEELPMAATGTNGAVSGVGKYFAKNPTLALAAASMLDRGPKQQKGFSGPLVNPHDALYNALSATYRAGQGFTEQPNVKLRGLLPNAPQPVNIPGLPFQIGGGMGHNPAMDDMEVDRSSLSKYDPFQSIAQGQMNPPKKRGM